jgi:hypothetical protein
MPGQLTGIIIVSNYNEKFTAKYKNVTGGERGKGEEAEEFLDFQIYSPSTNC